MKKEQPIKFDSLELEILSTEDELTEVNGGKNIFQSALELLGLELNGNNCGCNNCNCMQIE